MFTLFGRRDKKFFLRRFVSDGTGSPASPHSRIFRFLTPTLFHAMLSEVIYIYSPTTSSQISRPPPLWPLTITPATISDSPSHHGDNTRPSPSHPPRVAEERYTHEKQFSTHAYSELSSFLVDLSLGTYTFGRILLSPHQKPTLSTATSTSPVSAVDSSRICLRVPNTPQLPHIRRRNFHTSSRTPSIARNSTRQSLLLLSYSSSASRPAFPPLEALRDIDCSSLPT